MVLNTLYAMAGGGEHETLLVAGDFKAKSTYWARV